MAYTADRRPLTRQPQHFTRLADEYQGRVGFCFVASNPREMVSGRALSQRNGTHTMQIRPNMAAQATAPQGALYPAALTLTNSPQIAALQSGMFALWVGSITQADTTYFSLFSRYGTTSHTGAFYSGMWRLCVNASGYVELVIDGDTAQSTITSGLQVEYNKPLVIGFEVRDTSIVFWLNGARDEVTGVDVAITLGSVAVQINVGATQWAFDGHRYARCQMAVAAQERLPLARLAFNPWQILAGNVDDTWFSAGGGASTITATVSVSAAIQAAQAATASVNAAIQAGQSASASVNAAVAQARTVQAALDAAVLQARSATSSADAAVQQALAATASIDGVIQATGSASSGVDAAVQAGRSATASVNAYVQAGAGLVASIDAYIQAGSSNVASVDAVIQQARTGNATIDAVVSRALSASASLAAAVLDHRTATASINTYIQAGTTIGAGIEAAIQAQQSASASINAAVSVARSASVSLAAVIAVHASVDAAMDAAVLEARNGAIGVGAYIYSDDILPTFTVTSRRRIGGTPARDPGTRLGGATARSSAARIGDKKP